LVCSLEEGVHSPCNTHDNFLRPLFNAFFSRTAAIWQLHRIWQADPTLASLVELVETTASGNGSNVDNAGVTLLHVPKMKFPNRMTMREIHIIRTHEEISEARLKEQALIDAEKGEIKELLTRARAEASASAEKKLSSPRSMKSHNYYARDKLAMKGDWHAWLRQHSHG